MNMQVSQYFKQLKKKKLSDEECNNLLKNIHQYGSADDYSKAINILKEKNTNKNIKKNRKKKKCVVACNIAEISDSIKCERQEKQEKQEEMEEEEQEKQEISEDFRSAIEQNSESIVLDSKLEEEQSSESEMDLDQIPDLEKLKQEHEEEKNKKKQCGVCGKYLLNPNTKRHQLSKYHLKKM